MPKRRHKRIQSYSRIPWILLFIVIVGAGGLFFYGQERYRLLEDEYTEVKKELGGAKDDRRQLDEKLRGAEATLDRSAVDTRTNRGRFKQSVEEADDIGKQLVGIVGAERGKVVVDDDRLILRLDASSLFTAGTAKLSKGGRLALDKMGKMLSEMRERDIFVEGHSADDPVSQTAKGYETNWEFTSARSVAVIRYLQDEVGIVPDRLAAGSFAEYRPASRSKKNKNRRIDIVLAPKGLRRVGE